MVVHMSNVTYSESMRPPDKPLVWLSGEVKTPPFSPAARLEAGFLLRKLQRGETPPPLTTDAFHWLTLP